MPMNNLTLNSMRGILFALVLAVVTCFVVRSISTHNETVRWIAEHGGAISVDDHWATGVSSANFDTRIEDVKVVDDDAVARLVELTPDLRHLNLLGTYVTPSSIHSIIRFSKLQKLAIPKALADTPELNRLQPLGGLRELIAEGTVSDINRIQRIVGNRVNVMRASSFSSSKRL